MIQRIDIFENTVMGKPDPQKRKPIHEKALLDEIRDNVKNSAVVAQSKLEKMHDSRISDDDDDDDDSNAVTSDSCSFDDDLQKEPPRNMNETYDINDQIVIESKTHKLKKRRQKDVRSKSMINAQAIPDYKPNISLTHNYQHKRTQDKKNDSNKTKYMIYILVIGVIIFLFSLYMSKDDGVDVIYMANDKEMTKAERMKSVMENVKTTLKSMRSKYQNQKKELWQDVFIAIRNIVHDPKRTSIIVLLGDKSDPLDCLAVLLGNVSSNALNSGSLILTPEKFESDMGLVIESLRLSIKDRKAVIVWDLLNINVEALKAFHNLCDTINPLVEEVIYIITIIADDYDKESDPLKFIEKELFKKLSGKIKDDAIYPLITRITDGPILAIKPEPSIVDCPLPKATKKS